MGARHAHALHHHGHSRVHVLAPEAKVAATAVFVLAVAATPREAAWAFATHGSLLVGAVALARLPVRFVLARLAVVLPFVAFAFLLPFVAGGSRTPFAGILVSHEGLLAAGNILAKATLGAGASILLVGTTEPARILTGLERLRVPATVTTIAAFMLRYLEVLAEELGRMRTAMTARGYDPRWLWQTRPIASAAGALFVRSYERGERVHAAMVSRGFRGSMPVLDEQRASRRQWAQAALVPAIAATTSAVAIVTVGW